MSLLAEKKRRSDTSRFETDFPLYAANRLKIRAKSGAIEQFRLNRSQTYIHNRLEQQKAEKGWVRALILKGRQQGCSTYVGGRFYWTTTRSNGLRTFILTHEDSATQNLFEMVNRYHEHMPDEERASTSASNAKELVFDLLDSGYKVGTAGTKGVGRSSTIQLFHGSEVAFWPHAETHKAGIIQAIPLVVGTEVILESTANGLGNFFHQEWQAAERGESDFQAIFVPWFWQDEYARPVPTGFRLTEEEMDYADAYHLTPEQAAWRRAKLVELKDPLLFKQEYPANASEAFQLSGHDSYISPELVLRARKAKCQGNGPLVIGFDPAWMGEDRHSMAWRQGRHVLHVESKTKLDTMESVGWAVTVIRRDKPDRMFIDVGGVGAGVYDRLREIGYGWLVRAVNFGSKPFYTYTQEHGGPANRRAEMWMRSKEWLEDEAGAQIPDSDGLQTDACGPTYKHDSLGRLLLERKEDMRKRAVNSPDEWDAVALTFAEPVVEEPEDSEETERRSVGRDGRNEATGY